MSHALSIRHRASATHDGTAPFVETHVDEAGARDFKEKRGKSSSKDTRLALAAVVCFLILGLASGYFLLHHRHRSVIVHIARGRLENRLVHHHGGVRTGKIQGLPHFVTVVLPSVVNPPGRLKRLQAITETWGSTARALYVVHNISEFPDLANEIVSTDSVDISSHTTYPKLLLVPPTISPDEGVPRLNYGKPSVLWYCIAIRRVLLFLTYTFCPYNASYSNCIRKNRAKLCFLRQ